MTCSVLVVLQTVLTLHLDGAPVRFGVPVPAAAVADGLRLGGAGALQWRRLPVGDAAADPVWIELAIAGARGTVRVQRGGAGPCADGRGPAFVRDAGDESLPEGRVAWFGWRWCDGTVDSWRRTQFTAPVEADGETFAVGEYRTEVGAGLARRALPVVTLPRACAVLGGLLPPGGNQGRALRRQLASAVAALRELPGERGAGDYARSDAITNLEYDTTLALLRQAIGAADAAAFARALRSARHLVDRDLDLRTGLPFAHGPEHRVGEPEPGHAWLQGLLQVGLWSADDGLIAAAKALAAALAAQPPRGTGRNELARDYAWPLGELEALLAIAPDPFLARAADRLAVAIDLRYDAVLHTYRFGEGELGGGLHLERGWLTGGVVVPAMAAHLRRHPDGDRAARLASVQRELATQIGSAHGGVPTHWRCAGGRTFAEHLARDAPQAVLMLDGLREEDRERLLRRGSFARCFADVLVVEDPDLPTSFTLVGRSEWVWR